LNVQRLGAGHPAIGIGGDLVDPRFGLPQQFLAAALQGFAALVNARSKLSVLTSTWVLSAILRVPDAPSTGAN